jgi:putative transposase
MPGRQALEVPGRYGFHSTRSRHPARGVKLVMSDAHEGMKATVAMYESSWQRCCFDFMRNALAHAARPDGASSPPSKPFARDDAEAAKTQWRKVADQFRHKLPKLAPFRGGGDRRARLHDLPPQHRTKLHSTNPIERLNGVIKRRTEVAGIFLNENAVVRLIGAILLEQNEEWGGSLCPL